MKTESGLEAKVDPTRAVNWCTRSDISPLRYPGGKRKLAPFIADLISKTRVRPALFVEPFAGGASVSISLLEADYVDAIALADADPLVASFWATVFSSDADRLANMIYDAKVTLEEWIRLKQADVAPGIDAAFKCIFLNRTSFSGSLHQKAGPIGGMAQASDYKIDCRFNQTKIAERILELSRLRHRVRFVRNETYRKTIRDIRKTAVFRDTPDKVFWYLDPPFFAKADKLYRCHFAKQDHIELAAATRTIPGNWLLSYDAHVDAQALYESHPGYALVNLQYSARIDEKQRLVAKEIVVANIIADLRAKGELQHGAEIIPIPLRRQKASANIEVLERTFAIG
ncbi:DNA adenine methylase [Pseudorhizobium pelagicum]|uniref:DNA adenine methylase n=1 Tax=Pseudorhizobium pelagicum TaxID=1509405 RepID=UPI0009DD5EC4|nr:DNA adenine methylase [Pseudorhizobium pelagicum]